MAPAADALFSTCRTCEIGVGRAVGQPYRSLVHLVREGDARVADQFLDWVAGLPQAGVYAVLIVLSAVENVFPPVPADVAVVLGAFLSQRGHGAGLPARHAVLARQRRLLGAGCTSTRARTAARSSTSTGCGA